jgi:Fe-S cluster assembly ATPase SufC
MANKKIIEEINKYCRSDSILIITKEGKLLRLNCPFYVIVIYGSQVYKKGEKVSVEAVKISDELQLLYLIEKILFPYYLFAIII